MPGHHYIFLRHTIFPLARKRLHVVGEEFLPREGAFLIVGNHQSYLDPPMVGLVVIPKRKTKIGFLTKIGVVRAFGPFASYLGMIPVVPENKAESLKHATAWAQKGNVICIFPEGKRNYDPTVLTKGKTGAARIALHTGIPVVPVGIRVPQGKTTAQSIRQFFFSRVPLELRFGQQIRFTPIPDEDITRDLLEETTRTMMRAVSSLCGKTYPF